MMNEMEKEMDKEMDCVHKWVIEVGCSFCSVCGLSEYFYRLNLSAIGKVVTISLSKQYCFEGDLLVEYFEQLDDYEDTPSQREWFVMDRFIGEEALSKLDKGFVMKVEEK